MMGSEPFIFGSGGMLEADRPNQAFPHPPLGVNESFSDFILPSKIVG